MAKADILHVFRPVRPADWQVLCYTWDERVYVDLRLPFGPALSPSYLLCSRRRFT